MCENIYNKLVGVKFNKIFKQLNLLIINFGKPIKFSIHVACMVRIYNNKLLLTSSDEFFTKEAMNKSEETYKQLNEEKIIVDSDDLLSHNIKAVNRLLKNAYVERIELTKCMDLVMYFNNEIVIQILPDCLGKDYEFYRFIEFIPDINSVNYLSKHFVVLNDKGNLIFKFEGN